MWIRADQFGMGQACVVGSIDPVSGDTIANCGPDYSLNSTNINDLPLSTGQPSVVASVTNAMNTAAANSALAAAPSSSTPLYLLAAVAAGVIFVGLVARH